VFLDRDGTIIEAVHYLRDPERVRLLPGAAGAIADLRAAGYACVVVSNQSAVGRGMLTVERLMEVQGEVDRQLAEAGTLLDGFYYCPAVPASDDRTAVDHPERKPAPGMLTRAAAELGLDLARSWMVGDMISDVLAGRAAGCLGSIFLTCGQGNADDVAELESVHIAADLAEAARRILADG
jgi:D-glycero-D-manno-heptose 1,7-bisphosphate phosphatase